MPFKQVFERKVNDNMNEEDPQVGRVPPEDDIKKMHLPEDIELEDIELHDKKDSPPRFSTLFGTTPPPQPQPAQPVYYPAPEQRRRGVLIPTPLFVVFAIILFFESTILFAYTIIGLYNNAPSRLMPWAGPGVATACEQHQHQQPAINFAPNFVIGDGQPVVNTILKSAEAESLPTLTTSTSTSTSTSSSSSSTSSSSSSTEPAAAASNIAGILGGLTTSTSPSLPESTVVSMKFITSIIPPVVTVTSTAMVAGATITG